MALPSDNETWLIDEGARVIEKKTRQGRTSLTPRERLIYCFWVADYGMNNAGDLQTAEDLYAAFQSEGLQCARELGLKLSVAAFSLGRLELEKEYFQRFESICDEIRALTD